MEDERKNRNIAECICTHYNNLHYKAIPKVMPRYLAMVSTKQLNWFPDNRGV